MTTKSFTLGIYEDRRVYFWLIAEAAREFVSNGTLDEVFIVWYWLNQTLANWTQTIAQGETDTNPFGEKPYLIHLTKDNYILPGEESPGKILAGALEWDGQKDLPESLKAEVRTPGKFCVIKNIVECPRPNMIVIDHELFRRDTAEAVLPEGCAQWIKKGLESYYGGPSNTPPVFLSSLKPLAGVTGLDTLGIGRGRGPGARWFPRPEEKLPKKLPEGFEQALREEVRFWLRNRGLLGAKYDRISWPSYSPPLDHVLVSDQSDLKLSLESPQEVVFRQQELSLTSESDVLLAPHCKAYLEIRKQVSENDVDRLSKLAERFPIPVVLLYWSTSPNVGNLADSGVLGHLVSASNGKLKNEMEEAANDWIQRMAALDTLVGSKPLTEIRDDLLRWRLSSDSGKGPVHIRNRTRKAMLVVGPTGAGKTAVSKWCHFFSNHILDDDKALTELWQDIPVPASRKGFAVRLGNVQDKTSAKNSANGGDGSKEDLKSNVEVIKFWAKKLIEHGASIPPRGADLKKLLQTAFKTSGRRPWQVNLVGVTREDEFVMQIAGAYPAWTGNVGVSDWRPGAVLNATNNSLILNEVGELESKAQGLLLELIERGGPIRPMFAPIDGEVQAKNVLFIMATDRVDRIREQLLHRCRVVRVPSLLTCKDDIPEIARHRLLPQWCCLSEGAEQLLKSWPYWPGNHRSLHAVLDFAAERLPSNQRVIRVTDVIHALWRENSFRVPTRLKTLVEWILEWPELDTEPVENVIPTVAENLIKTALTDDGSLMDKFNRIADMTFKNPSAHFSDLLRLNEQREKLGRLRSVMKETKLERADDLYQRAAEGTPQNLGESISLANLSLCPGITIELVAELLQSLENKGSAITGATQDLKEINALFLKILRLYVHEIFWTMEKRTTRVKRAVVAANSAPEKKPLELLSDQEQRLTTGLHEDALIMLSLGTLLWKVLHVEPKDIFEANDLILMRPTKPSGKKKTAASGAQATSQPVEVLKSELQTKETSTKAEKQKKGKNVVPTYDNSRISTTAKLTGQYGLAVIKALDNRTGRGLFDYSDDRRTRAYFGQGLDADDEDDQDDE